jgi:hypothetical protein
MRGPAAEGVQSNLFSTVTIVAQRHCVEFAERNYRKGMLHHQIFAMSKSRCKWYRLDTGMGSASAVLRRLTVALLRPAPRDIFPAEE